MKEGFALRPYQQRAVDFVRDSLSVYNNGEQDINSAIIVLPTGCHALGEQLLMADGTIRRVEDIRVGDALSGEDGSTRTVLYIHSGEANLYKIVPVKGEPFVVTGNHKLTLVRTKARYNPKRKKEEYNDGYLDIAVEDYLALSNYQKHLLKLVRSRGVEFQNSRAGIPTMDPYSFGLSLKDVKDSDLKDFHIPADYKYGSRTTRLNVLAGLLDTDGSLSENGNNVYDYITKSKALAEDIQFVAKSLGLAAYICKCKKSIKSLNFTGEYYRISISGETSIIPCRVKVASDRRQKKNVLRTGFSVEPVGLGKFIGFTVDGDNRYLLSDFTITHNCGKTICFSSIVENELNDGGRVLVLAHRNKLLEQAHDKLLSACDIDASYEGKDGGDDRVVICSIQSMSRDDRLNKYDPDYFSLIIVDETHHIASPSYLKVRDYFSGAKLVGVTATPVRGDGHDTRIDFDVVGPEYTTQQAIEDGYLTPVHVKKLPLKIDISDVHLQGGDYSAGEVANVLNKYLVKIAKKTAEVASDRKTVVFVPLVTTAQKMAEIYRSVGMRAEYVSGDRKDSDEILKKFEQGEYDVVVNSMLLTEGWDCPSVDCVINLRPTRSESLYTQIIGRGLRLAPGKTSALVLDFLWQDTGRGQLSVEEVLAPPEDEYEKRAMDRLLETGEEYSLEELKNRAREGAANEREIALQEALQRANLEKEMRLREDAARRELYASLEQYAMNTSKEKGISPFDVYGVIRRGQKKNVKVKYHCMSGDIVAIHIDDKAMEAMSLSKFYLSDGVWQQNLPSIGQLKFATQLGIPQEYLVCSGQVSEILNKLESRARAHLGTYKQLRILANAGQQDLQNLTSGECARRMKMLFAGRNAHPRTVSSSQDLSSEREI